MILYKSLSDNHKQSRRNALSGYVGHNYRKVALIDHKEAVEVPADLLRRVHRSVYVKFMPLRERREDAGKHRSLDMPCNVELRAYPLLFG